VIAAIEEMVATVEALKAADAKGVLPDDFWCQLRLHLAGRKPVFTLEPHLPNHEIWWFDEHLPRVFVGVGVWRKLQLELAACGEPNILETDPGPLDARVP
jgi:hypothetical protein